MSQDERSPQQVLGDLKDNMHRRGRLETQIRDVDAEIARDTAKLAPLFPLGQERRFRVGPSWDPHFCRATMTEDGLRLTFEMYENVDGLKWPEEPAPVDAESRGQAAAADDAPDDADASDRFLAQPPDPAMDLIDVELSTEPAAAMEPAVAAIDETA